MINGKKVFVSIDVGADTTKSAYAFYDYNNQVNYQLALYNGLGIPSSAYYNVEEGKWSFGSSQINFLAKDSFRYIVKIKELLNLFHSAAVDGFYDKKHFFRNFYYPPIENETYADAVQRGHFFEAKQTPKEVCQLFFTYCIDKIKEEIYERFDSSVQIAYVVVYPSFAPQKYIEELRSFVINASGALEDDVIVLSAPKAVGVAAKEFQIVGNRIKNVLIFNVGEDEISVVKTRFDANNVKTYSSDGHNPPEAIGGRDVDLALNALLTDRSADINPFGSADFTQQGETGSYYDQFCMQQEIKYGKTIFSNSKGCERLNDQVMFSVYREMITSVPLSKEEFKACCEKTAKGKKGSGTVFGRIWDYVLTELNLPVNQDVEAVLFAGGAADTYGLDTYIQQKLKSNFQKKIAFLDFSPDNDKILCEAKDTVPIGAALFGSGKYKFSIIASSSYGTYSDRGDHLVYQEMLRKNEEIPIQGKIVEKECWSDVFNLVGGANQQNKEGEYYLFNEYYCCSPASRDFFDDHTMYLKKKEGNQILKYTPQKKRADDKKGDTVLYGAEEPDGKPSFTFNVIGFYKMVFYPLRAYREWLNNREERERYKKTEVFKKYLQKNKISLNAANEEEALAKCIIINLSINEGFEINSEGRATPKVRAGWEKVKEGNDIIRQEAPYCYFSARLEPNGNMDMVID